MSKQRVFSHNKDLNYIDFNQNRNGSEILKTIKIVCQSITNNERDNYNEINRFKNHSDFLTLTKSNYNYLDIDK
jgi:hypothetical protein